MSLATVYGCKGCAAGLVFMCVSRASLACCDCYPQRLFGKLGAATAVSGFRAKELDPYHRRCRTVHQGIEATTPDEPRVANAKNIDVHGRLHQPLWWAAPSEINDALLAAGAAEER